jgi:hypothetical protein
MKIRLLLGFRTSSGHQKSGGPTQTAAATPRASRLAVFINVGKKLPHLDFLRRGGLHRPMSVVRVPFQDANHLLTVFPGLSQPHNFLHVRLRQIIELSEMVNAALVCNLLAGSIEGTIGNFDAALKVLQLGDSLAVLRLQGKVDELLAMGAEDASHFTRHFPDRERHFRVHRLQVLADIPIALVDRHCAKPCPDFLPTHCSDKITLVCRLQFHLGPLLRSFLLRGRDRLLMTVKRRSELACRDRQRIGGNPVVCEPAARLCFSFALFDLIDRIESSQVRGFKLCKRGTGLGLELPQIDLPD